MYVSAAWHSRDIFVKSGSTAASAFLPAFSLYQELLAR